MNYLSKKMTDLKDTGFKSYILDESNLESVSLNDVHRTKLLPGETLVTEAHKVMMFAPLSDRKKGTLGALSVTTFKLSFISANDKENEEVSSLYQHNLLLEPYEICLSSIDSVYHINDKSKKKLPPGQSISTKVKELLIVCKNMRVFEFSFKFSEKDCGKNIANAILHHSYPKIHSLLFAYEYKEPYYKTLKDTRLFRSAEDWKRELQRTGCKNWRITYNNQNFQMSPSLPQALVVPDSVTDGKLNRAVEHFRNRFCPVWVWGTPEGSALIRMSDILPTITDRTQENIMLENVRKSHAEKRPPYIMDLNKECPSCKDIQNSYMKLRELCAADSIRLFKTQDFKFYGLLDGCKWIQHVSACLTKASIACNEICVPNPTTVVLQEGSGHDLNCVISSLIQLMLDPYWRTVSGFQSLIQKEWVALGHPFASRLGLIWNQETECSPVLLLFLDCVWQLLQQFPTAFQFTETFLTTIWDCTYISIFETFLFNCEHDRYVAQTGTSPLKLRSLWDWKEQFTEKDIALFCNPLYDDTFRERLKPNTSVPFLDVWTLCYFRWIPDLEIRNGGSPQVDLPVRFITSEIYLLRQQLINCGINGSALNGTTDENLQMLKRVNSFFPFSINNGQIPGILQINTALLADDGLDSQSMFNQSIAD